MTVHYQSGTWTAALTEGRAVVSSDAALVLELWPVLTADGDLLGSLLQRPVTDPQDLVVIDGSGSDVVVLVRGGLPVLVESDGLDPVTLDAGRMRTWVERHFPAGSRVTVGTIADRQPQLPVVSAVVLVSAVTLDPARVGTEPGRPAPPPTPAPIPATPPAATPPAAPPVAAAPLAATPVAPAPPRGKDTLVGPVETDLEHLFDHTVNRPIESAAVRDHPTAEAPAPAAAIEIGDHDGTTITAEQLRAIGRDGRDNPAAAGTGTVPVASELSYRIGQEVIVVLSTGRELPLSGPIVVGRQPRVDRWSGPVAPTLVTVPADRESDISRTHLRIERIDGRVVVTDLNAANGSVVLRPDGETDLRDGATATLGPTDRVAIGDGVTLSLRVQG